MDSVWFVFLFLPAVILLNYLTPSKYRSIIVSVFSVLFLLFTDTYMLPLMLVFVLVDYVLAIFVDKSKSMVAKNALVLSNVRFC